MKGQPPEEKARLLALAGNPKNGLVEKLKSIPNGYRILTRSYAYDPVKKRSRNSKHSIGVVIDDKFCTSEEYRRMYTKRGLSRAVIPDVTADAHADDNTETDSPAKPSENRAADSPADFVIYQRLLEAIPILHGAAVNSGILEDLKAAYGDTVIANKILSIAMHWIMARDSSANRFPIFSKIYALPFQRDLSEKQLARLYSKLGANDAAKEQLFSRRSQRFASRSSISYDSVNIPENAEDTSLNSPLSEEAASPAMHLSVLTDRDTGMPLRYKLFNGDYPDGSAACDLIPIIQGLSPDKDFLFVFDRRYETLDNLLSCSLKSIPCLMAVNDLDESFISRIRDKYDAFRETSAIIPGTSVHAHSFRETLSHRGCDFPVWAHAFRDDEKSSQENSDFSENLALFEMIWQRATKSERQELLRNPFSEFFVFNDADSNARPELNEEAIRDYTRNFGFSVLVSLQEMTAEEAYSYCRRRESIEKCFASGQMTINGAGEASRRDSMEGRFVIAFTALSIIAWLENELKKERHLADRRKKKIAAGEYSIADVTDLTQGITINYEVNSGKCWIGGKIEDPSRLAAACGLPEDLYDRKPDCIESLAALKQS